MARDLFGARWWRESLVRAAPGLTLVGGAALTLGGCAFDYPATRLEETTPAEKQDAEEVDAKADALALQRAQGWNVGVDQPLYFPDSTDADIAGTQSWRQAMEPLSTELAPPEQYLPFYVPTLYQSLIGQPGQGLRAVMRPILTPEMKDDFQRGLALRQEFAAADWPRDTAIVVDAPGPRAVATAAALADHFAPVFTFGNWPHPLGVVPAHQTLAAALYYRPAFQAAKQLRPDNAPPMFVLDANRLAPYRDADSEFDNRYFVSLPSAEALRFFGIKHVLLVSAGGQELDDLNDQLLGLQSAGVDVKMVALGDFLRAGDEPQVAGEPSENEVALAEAEEAADDDARLAWYPWLRFWVVGEPCHFWYRGGWWNRRAFWGDYGWHARGRVVGPPSVHRMLAPATGARWVAAPRPTMFGPGRVVGAPDGVRGGVRGGLMHPPHPPAGFGTVPVRTARGSGAITGVRAGRVGSFGQGGHFGGGHFVGTGGLGGRSGSIGRAGGGFGG